MDPQEWRATGICPSAARAKETARTAALFHDELAALMAGETGMEILRRIEATAGDPTPYIAVRTRFFDEYLLRAVEPSSQVVLVGAGMDTRCFRLSWPKD